VEELIVADKKHFDFLRVLSINTKKYCDIQLTEQQAAIMRRVFDDPIMAEKSWQNDPGSWIDNMFKWFNARIAAHNFIPTNEALVFLIPPERGFRPYVNKKKK
jgi:hypothetical protein